MKINEPVLINPSQPIINIYRVISWRAASSAFSVEKENLLEILFITRMIRAARPNMGKIMREKKTVRYEFSRRAAMMYRVVEKFGNKYAPVRLSEMRNSITSRARSRVLCKYACKVGMAYSELAGAEEEDESRIFWSLTTLNNLIILEHTLIRAYFSQKEPFPSGVWICLSISRENHDFFYQVVRFFK